MRKHPPHPDFDLPLMFKVWLAVRFLGGVALTGVTVWAVIALVNWVVSL